MRIVVVELDASAFSDKAIPEGECVAIFVALLTESAGAIEALIVAPRVGWTHGCLAGLMRQQNPQMSYNQIVYGVVNRELTHCEWWTASGRRLPIHLTLKIESMIEAQGEGEES